MVVVVIVVVVVVIVVVVVVVAVVVVAVLDVVLYSLQLVLWHRTAPISMYVYIASGVCVRCQGWAKQKIFLNNLLLVIFLTNYV